MESTLAKSASSPDRSMPTLAVLHRLIAEGGEAGDAANLSIRQVLERLVQVMEATRAGVHLLPELNPIACTGDDNLEGFPWESAPVVLERARACPTALGVPEPGMGDGGYLLCVLRGPTVSLLFWLHDARRSEWTAAECAVWSLAGSTLLRWMETASNSRWASQLERAQRQELIENANQVVRRLAHDFGNVFTSLLGFSELSLTQHLPANSPLHRYLTELHQSAQDGAHLTHRLRVLSRRQAQSVRSTPPAPLLLSEEARFRALLPAEASFELMMPPALPSVAIDTVHLQLVLGSLLENAREAIARDGTIRVSVQPVVLTSDDALDFYGAVHSGEYLEFRIEDNGQGLTEQARRRLFRDPFFSNKSRKGGFGLATAYGVLAAHQGGLCLSEREGQPGVVVRVVVPLAPVGRSNHGTVMNPLTSVPGRALRNELVLVVEDDPRALQLICTTLEQAGYRVQTARNTTEARSRMDAASGDPFHLILTDIQMPGETGLEFVRHLLQKEPATRYLLMSGQVSLEEVQGELVGDYETVLHKPFLPEALLRAVRESLDRPLRPGNHAGSREPLSKR